MVVVILCVSVMVTSSQLSGFNLNNLELSPNYAGTLKAMTNTVSNICGFVTPTLIGAITNGQVSCNCSKVQYILEIPNYVISLANTGDLEQSLLHCCWSLRLWQCYLCCVWQNLNPTMEHILEGGETNCQDPIDVAF